MNFKLWLYREESEFADGIATTSPIIRQNKSIVPSISKGEVLLGEILKRLFGSHDVQYQFDKCVNKKCLRFDASFLVEENNRRYVVEFHGAQHYKFTKHWHREITHFKGSVLRDKIKYDFCKENNIPLLVIPYWEINNMENIIKEFIKSEGFQENYANPLVPEKVRDQREKVFNDESIPINPDLSVELDKLRKNQNFKKVEELAEFYKKWKRYPFAKLKEEEKLHNWIKAKRQTYAGRGKLNKYEGEEQYGISLGLPNDWLKLQITTEKLQEKNNQKIEELANYYKVNGNYPPNKTLLNRWLSARKQAYSGHPLAARKYEGEEEYGISLGLPNDWLRTKNSRNQINQPNIVQNDPEISV